MLRDMNMEFKSNNHLVLLVTLGILISSCASVSIINAPSNRINDQDVCSECKQYIGEVQKVFADPQTAKELESYLDAVCDTLTNPNMTQQCKQDVKTWVPMILNYLAKQLDPTTVCKDFGLCTQFVGLNLPNSECDECKFFSNMAAKILHKESVKEKTEDFVAGLVCKHFASPFDCRQAVVVFTPEILNFASHLLSDGVACDLGNICQSSLSNEVSHLTESPQCFLCEYVLQYVDDMLAENATEQDIVRALDRVCSLLPSSLTGECQDFINTYGSAIIKLVAQQINASEICKKIGLCETPPSDRPTVDDANCALCELVMREIDEMLSDNATETQIIAAVDKVCSLLPSSLSSECQQFVNTYGPAVIRLLVQEIQPKQVCTLLGLCQQQQQQVPLGNADCALCEFVINELKKNINMNTTEKEIVTLVEGVCHYLPSSLSDECDRFVRTYGDTIIKLIVRHASPQEICTVLGMCGQQLIGGREDVSSSMTASAAPECALCEFVMREIEQMLQDNATDAQIIAAVDKVCSLLPSSLSSECQQFVNTYGPSIIRLLVQEIQPKQVCTLLGLCQQQQQETQAPQCAICEFIMSEIDKKLAENATEQEIFGAVKFACSFLPSTVAKECWSVVDVYGPAIINLLTREVKPSEVCGQLGLCTTHSEPIDAGPQCALCEFVMREIDQLLQDNATEQEIISAVDRVCALLPSSLASECQSFVNTYGPAIIRLLTQEIKPNEVCALLGLCSSKSTQPGNPEECAVCKMVCKYLEIALRDAKTEQEIEQILESMCHKLPAPVEVQQKCDNFVKQWAPYIVQILKQELINPDEICKEIKLCP